MKKKKVEIYIKVIAHQPTTNWIWLTVNFSNFFLLDNRKIRIKQNSDRKSSVTRSATLSMYVHS